MQPLGPPAVLCCPAGFLRWARTGFGLLLLLVESLCERKRSRSKVSVCD